MKTIKLSCYGITVTLDDTMVGFGKIESDLQRGEVCREYNGNELNAIESLILAHAVAGVDIESFAYIEGIETAVDAIKSNI